MPAFLKTHILSQTVYQFESRRKIIIFMFQSQEWLFMPDLWKILKCICIEVQNVMPCNVYSGENVTWLWSLLPNWVSRHGHSIVVIMCIPLPHGKWGKMNDMPMPSQSTFFKMKVYIVIVQIWNQDYLSIFFYQNMANSCEVWGGITYPFLNFISCTIEV